MKLSNTLVVRNHRRFFPSREEVMYLSGAPLHVITLNLVERFRRARPDVPISFSAGVDGRNFPDCVALGFTPVTDLLRPGGYARLPRYLDNFEERMRALGVRRLGDYVVVAAGRGEEAIRAPRSAAAAPAGPGSSRKSSTSIPSPAPSVGASSRSSRTCTTRSPSPESSNTSALARPRPPSPRRRSMRWCASRLTRRAGRSSDLRTTG